MRRYRENINDMLHELTLMRNRGEIKVPENMTKTEFEEIMKKIDTHFQEDGVSIHHPYIRGRITDTSSIEHLNKFFQNLYATTNSRANHLLRARNAHNTRTRAAINRITATAAARTARTRREIPLAAANAARRRTIERSARATVRNMGTAVARAAANAARARNATRRSTSRSRRSTGTRV